jgi:hypothetical protein
MAYFSVDSVVNPWIAWPHLHLGFHAVLRRQIATSGFADGK